MITIHGKEYAVKRLGTNGKTATARIRGNAILIRIPVSWPREEGFKAFLELEKKVIADLEKNPEKFEKSKMPKAIFTDGQEVALLGKTFRIAVRQGRSRASRARIVEDTIEITLAAGLSEEKRVDHISNLARRAISHAVKPLVEKRVHMLNEKHFNFQFRKVFIKETSSRWGSCSEDANINLNFALLNAPQDVMDSVIIHELAHLKEKNHGEGFWTLVKNAMPDYSEKRKWLNENASKLGMPTVENEVD